LFPAVASSCLDVSEDALIIGRRGETDSLLGLAGDLVEDLAGGDPRLGTST